MAQRPNRPLVVKCGYEGSTRRIHFPAASTCRLESIRQRVEDCFHLSAAPFSLSYTDDDGEEFSLKSEEDLSEAISYFTSGDDDQAASIHSGITNTQRFLPSIQKITIRLDVLVEYDGPSLSDTSSILSFQTGSSSSSGSGSRSGQSADSWANGSRYSRNRSNDENRLRDPLALDEDDFTEYQASSSGQGLRELDQSLGGISLNDDSPTRNHEETTPRSGSRRGSISSQKTFQPSVPLTYVDETPQLPLTGPESLPAPSLLTQSELGSRWLREQSNLTRRHVGTSSGTRLNSGRKYDSDEDSLGSDEESIGDFDLVKDDRGRYYYSYHSAEAGSSYATSQQNGRSLSPSSLSIHRASPLSLRTPSPPGTPVGLEVPTEPIIAPDCSACGTRLSYMRYVCQSCGEGDMWKEHEPFKPTHAVAGQSNQYAVSDGSSERGPRRADSDGDQTEYGVPRHRSESLSTTASRDSMQVATGADPTSPYFLKLKGVDDGSRAHKARGYELCPSCIESHGVTHSKQAAKDAGRRNAMSTSARGRTGHLRHTFREKIWGPQGWQDVEYNEETECTICTSRVTSHRFKCVSCPKFDLCRTCYHKVEDIHPAHVFLSLPDKDSSPMNVLEVNGASDRQVGGVRSQPMRHPGVFCHNCLKDIVGPRFHCAVCPSWDLCIQCEGSADTSDQGGHTADHIMMKIPIPLAVSEIQAVSRRARDRWIQQDSTAVASQNNHLQRSPSPTNETVYAGGDGNGHVFGNTTQPRPSAIVQVTTSDPLDHGCRCDNCHDWIRGKRYQCANCPSKPRPYNLCSICELKSYKIHDPFHVFFKFDKPVDTPLSSTRPFLPILYKSKVGQIPTISSAINHTDPTSYLKHVLHRETLCDIHSDQIRGIWLRCVHCPSGFDICQEAEEIAEHDPTHVFVVFKARVNMLAFRDLADLGSDHPKPLLRDRVYYS